MSFFKINATSNNRVFGSASHRECTSGIAAQIRENIINKSLENFDICFLQSRLQVHRISVVFGVISSRQTKDFVINSNDISVDIELLFEVVPKHFATDCSNQNIFINQFINIKIAGDNGIIINIPQHQFTIHNTLQIKV